MGLPNVVINFKTAASAAIQRGDKGTVAVVLRDAKAPGGHVMTSAAQIPEELGAGNQAYLRRAFTGYVNPPKKVLAYVLGTEAEQSHMTDALEWLGTQNWDYLAAPPEVTQQECTAIVSWIKGRRESDYAVYKAVLPNTAADNEAVVNFTTAGIKVGSDTYDAGDYCSRIAGLIAGTPMNISCTYATLPEVSDVMRLTREEMDTAVEAGKFILFHDGEKVKVGRGVNSLTTTTADKGDIFKKLKIVETLDMIRQDIRRTAEDSYIGKYSNSYDNKLVLCTAIKAYLSELEREGILQTGSSSVSIDVDAQALYLQGQGRDTSAMSEQEIKEANTGSGVFIRVRCKPLDVIEDITIQVNL
ncbi:MAG: phage tail sheath C-terminal domain-containing protein [Pseudoflavonifractor sp.]|nr:phage tail sheath C-terminal domain-containing protein [Pseudoflavonifractor sp.]